MSAYCYRCPNTGQTVQGWSATAIDPDERKFEAVTCLACGTVHLVNTVTGKVLGED
jgi:hypothetical protein